MANTKPTKTELLDLALDLCERDENEGICLECGEVQDCVEPDARHYHCESCGADRVYGREEALTELS